MPTFTPATPTDVQSLLAMICAFYAEERLTFSSATQSALGTLLSRNDLGSAFLIHDDAGLLAGYFIVAFTFSLERGGKTALLDELYIVPTARRKGLGKAALHFAISEAKRTDCKAVVLEVDHANPAAHALYSSLGFATLARHFLVLSL